MSPPARREAGALSHARERIRFPGVRGPMPLLSPETERGLTVRQREILEELEGLLEGNALADLTMAQIAAAANCSLRTLYGIAPSKDELILTLLDRRLHRIGRRAIAALDASRPPLESLRLYLSLAHEAVSPEASAASEDFADVAGTRSMVDAHESYVTAIAKSLLDQAVARGDALPVDTAAVAHVLGGLGREFARAEVAELVSGSPKATADAVADLLLRGLAREAPSPTSGGR